MNEQIRQLKIGNIYGEYCGTGFAGNVYDSNGVSPCLTTFDGGNRQPLIIEEEQSPPELIVVADIFQRNGHQSAAGRVYDPCGVSPTIGASHFDQIKYIYVDSDKR